jgi:hypothetical protein
VGKDQVAQGSFNQFAQGTRNVPGCPQKDCRSPESALGKVASTEENLNNYTYDPVDSAMGIFRQPRL